MPAMGSADLAIVSKPRPRHPPSIPRTQPRLAYPAGPALPPCPCPATLPRSVLFGRTFNLAPHDNGAL
eukprot:12889013-Prorocentrum_lima.AAC.1